MKNKVKIFGIIAIVAIIGFSMAACDSGGDSGGGGGGNTDPKTITIVDVPSSWAGTIYVGIFSEFKTSGVPDFAADGIFPFSGGIINANFDPFNGTGEYYVTIQVSNSSLDGYVYFGSGNSPSKVNITEKNTTLSFNQFQNYNIWR